VYYSLSSLVVIALFSFAVLMCCTCFVFIVRTTLEISTCTLMCYPRHLFVHYMFRSIVDMFCQINSINQSITM